MKEIIMERVAPDITIGPKYNGIVVKKGVRLKVVGIQRTKRIDMFPSGICIMFAGLNGKGAFGWCDRNDWKKVKN